MDWSEERTSTLKKLWLEGLTASKIAKQLGGVTRSAVCGKVSRLGITRPPQPRSRPVRPVRSPATASFASRRVREVEPDLPTTPYVDLPEEAGSATLETLGAHMCKWPIGDPHSEEFTFCGRRSVLKGPYCDQHTRGAYRRLSKRKDA